MATKILFSKPTSPGSRHIVKAKSDALKSSTKPCKFLTVGLNKKAGRDNKGRISVRHKCAGNKKRYRIIDFKRSLFGKKEVNYVVVSVEYDPNRTSHIALIKSELGQLSYILASEKTKTGDKLIFSDGNVKNPLPGYTMMLKNIPSGLNVYNIEFAPGQGGKIARSAGTFCSILGMEDGYALVKMPSGELRKFHENCRASIGETSNKDHVNEKIGKAGRSFAKGKRPTVRGIAMNPVDHPMGGRTNGGKHPCSPTGVKSKGLKTRNKNKKSFFIVKRRK